MQKQPESETIVFLKGQSVYLIDSVETNLPLPVYIPRDTQACAPNPVGANL